MNLRTISGLAVAFILGFGAATWLDAPTPGSTTAAAKSTSAAQPHDNSPNLIIAGAYSKRCATATGICTMQNPLQVGTRCSCPDGSHRTVVR